MEEWNSCINAKHIFSPQLYLSPNLLLWNSHIRNCTKKSLFCRKITNSFFFYCFISPTYLKYHNWFMWSKASLSLLRQFSFTTVFLLSFKGRHFNFRMRWGFESFFLTEAELGQGGGWQCHHTCCPSPLPDGPQMLHHPPADFCKPFFSLLGLGMTGI